MQVTKTKCSGLCCFGFGPLFELSLLGIHCYLGFPKKKIKKIKALQETQLLHCADILDSKCKYFGQSPALGSSALAEHSGWQACSDPSHFALQPHWRWQPHQQWFREVSHAGPTYSEGSQPIVQTQNWPEKYIHMAHTYLNHLTCIAHTISRIWRIQLRNLPSKSNVGTVYTSIHFALVHSKK